MDVKRKDWTGFSFQSGEQVVTVGGYKGHDPDLGHTWEVSITPPDEDTFYPTEEGHDFWFNQVLLASNGIPETDAQLDMLLKMYDKEGSLQWDGNMKMIFVGRALVNRGLASGGEYYDQKWDWFAEDVTEELDARWTITPKGRAVIELL